MGGAAVGASVVLAALLWDAGAGWLALVWIGAGASAAALVAPGWRSAALAVLAILFATGMLWRLASTTATHFDTGELVARDRLVGVVDSIPRRYTSGASLTLLLDDPPAVRVEVLVPAYPRAAHGDRLQVTGLTVLPDDGFSPLPTLRSREVTILGSEATGVQRLRTRASDSIVDRVTTNVPQPGGALSAGILLGDDSGMTAATRDAFRAAGLSHLTAVSGWNVALIAGIFAALRRRGRLGPWLQVLLAIPGIWLYAYVVGLSPPVTRAAIMGTLYLIALWLGRPRDALTALVWAVAIMIVAEPSIRFDPGFQLSAAATFGLVVADPYLTRWPRWLAAPAVPLVAEIAVSPILLARFGTYSLVAPLANVLAEPLVTAVFFSSAGVVVASLIHPLLGEVAGLVAWVPARLVVAIAEWSASLDWASGRTLSPGLAWVVCAYAGLAVGYLVIWWRWPPLVEQ